MKRLWVLPLAAILCGQPVNPPHLKPPLAESRNPCLASAQKSFLMAFAYRGESPEKSRRFLSIAEHELLHCEEPVLRARLSELKSLSP